MKLTKLVKMSMKRMILALALTLILFGYSITFI